MPAYNFQTRFAAKVESGEKCQTIRRRRKRPTKPGETLYLYTEQRTKNARKLREVKCVRVLPIEIRLWQPNFAHDPYLQVKVGFDWLSVEELNRFAVADGFVSAADFCAFWRDVHGLTVRTPLEGFELIQWEPKQ